MIESQRMALAGLPHDEDLHSALARDANQSLDTLCNEC